MYICVFFLFPKRENENDEQETITHQVALAVYVVWQGNNILMNSTLLHFILIIILLYLYFSCMIITYQFWEACYDIYALCLCAHVYLRKLKRHFNSIWIQIVKRYIFQSVDVVNVF